MPTNARSKFGGLILSWVLFYGAGLSCRAAVPGPAKVDFPPAQGPPTQAIPGGAYVGREACAACHSEAAKSKGGDSMARAMETAAECEILKAHPRLSVRKEGYTYQIIREGNRSIYRVTDGKHTISENILWAFGLGSAGQTYVFRHQGEYFQSRVSFYNDTQGLDLTLGVPDAPPTSIEEAVGSVISEEESRLCFGCHSTGAVSGDHMQFDRLIPGVTCEGCHGPGGKHIAAVQSGNSAGSQIFNPGSLDTGDLTRFCGSCHRTWEQVQLMHLSGVRTVRFQPYRLANSRCFDAEDSRISCKACHDPHHTVRRDISFYDAKCEACHTQLNGKVSGSSGKEEARKASICPVGKKNCVDCHMPKYSLPGAHFKFADHEIRIVRRGESYPD
ncbi:MAG TPA: multiheme c-type cytochrome [Terriglobia bacterium]|nr:multiheme c-type cytochrome [Terriglobia bacterium]